MGKEFSCNVKPRAEEPWVSIADGEALADWDHETEIAYNQNNRQVEKYKFFVKTFDALNDNEVYGAYHEYGCHRVRTFRMALTEARRHGMDNMKFFAFDSFAGLPETTTATKSLWLENPAALTTTEERFRELVEDHGIYTDKISTIKGFYDDSLTIELQKKFVDEEDKIALATIDCDLYESAVPVFDFIEPLLQEGSILYIDDLFCGYRGVATRGVGRAFLEFQQRSRFKFFRHLEIGWWGRSYIAYIDDDAPNGIL